MKVTRRRTTETDVRVHLRLDDDGSADVDTGLPFLDHMLTVLARYGGLALWVRARGDLEHHLIEDVAITLGLVFQQQLPASCGRYASRTVPMDEALVEATVDIGGRHYYQGPLPDSDYDHFMRSLAENGRWCVHLRVLRGDDVHHVVEAAFKAVGLALREASAAGDRVFSTKGAVELSEEEVDPDAA